MTTFSTPAPAPIRRHHALARRLGALLPASGRALAGSAAVLVTLGAAVGALSTSPASAATLNTGTTQTNCIADPSACGYPDATNSGVPAGMVLKNVPGQVSSGPGWYYDPVNQVVQVTANGTVLSGLNIPYTVNVKANNVTIEDDQITESGQSSFGVSLRHTTGVTIENNNISGVDAGAGRLMAGIKDIYGDSANTTITGNNIAMTGTGIQIDEGLISGNYIHNMGYIQGDHINGITSNGGTAQLTITGNTILNQISQTDCIGLFEDFNVQANRAITNNLLAGGGYPIYGGQNAGNIPTYNIQITGNRISTLYFANGGFFGPLAAFSSTGQGNVWSGNVWDSTGQPIS